VGKSSDDRPRTHDWLRPIFFVVLFGLVVAHAVAPSAVTLDTPVVILLGLCALVAIAPLLESAELLGIGNWQFKKRVAEAEETQHEVERESIEQAEEASLRRGSLPDAGPFGFEGALALFQIPDSLRDLIPSDPKLALAGLRLEVEQGLRDALEFLASHQGVSISESARSSPIRALEIIREATNRQLLSETQERLLQLLLDLCSQAVHGRKVEPIDASRVFDIADTLNRSFTLGYSLNYSPNPGAEDEGLVCEYEHCIENMPITLESTDRSCPFWGHDCPGGIELVSKCDVASQTQSWEPARA